MADTKSNRTETGKENGRALTRRERDSAGLSRWDHAGSSPFEFMSRMSDEMDRWFERVSQDLGFPRRSWLSRRSFGPAAGQGIWAPRIEAFHKQDKFTVRAELPGLKKEDVEVQLADDALTIRGERREEHEEEREGVYHSEREYGQFYRTIALPEGVITENAQATFRDGVLEITMPAAPAEVNRGRRLEIRDASQSEQKK